MNEVRGALAAGLSLVILALAAAIVASLIVLPPALFSPVRGVPSWWGGFLEDQMNHAPVLILDAGRRS